MWQDLKADDEFNLYFQDDYANEKGPNREYFFNILNTVHFDYLNQVMQHAAKERYAATG